MSVVCCKVYDNKIVVASDSIQVRGRTQSKGDNIEDAKLTKINDIIVGGVGFAEENAYMKMFCKTHKPSSPDRDDIMEFLIEFSDWKNKKTESYKIQNSYIFVVGGHAFIINDFLAQEIVTYEAIGAGMDYALSALYLGHGPKKAVKTACELSIYCEEPIITYVYDLD